MRSSDSLPIPHLPHHDGAAQHSFAPRRIAWSRCVRSASTQIDGWLYLAVARILPKHKLTAGPPNMPLGMNCNQHFKNILIESLWKDSLIRRTLLFCIQSKTKWNILISYMGQLETRFCPLRYFPNSLSYIKVVRNAWCLCKSTYNLTKNYLSKKSWISTRMHEIWSYKEHRSFWLSSKIKKNLVVF